jgi:hypothetical protein
LDATIRRAGDRFPENLEALSKRVKTAGAIGDFLVKVPEALQQHERSEFLFNILPLLPECFIIYRL